MPPKDWGGALLVSPCILWVSTEQPWRVDDAMRKDRADILIVECPHAFGDSIRVQHKIGVAKRDERNSSETGQATRSQVL